MLNSTSRKIVKFQEFDDRHTGSPLRRYNALIGSGTPPDLIRGPGNRKPRSECRAVCTSRGPGFSKSDRREARVIAYMNPYLRPSMHRTNNSRVNEVNEGLLEEENNARWEELGAQVNMLKAVSVFAS